MKRILTLALALLLLLTSACAEEAMAGTLKLTGLTLTHVTDKGERKVKFDGISLFFAMGSDGGTPILQATFDNGQGQVVDAVLQIEGSSMLLSVGGITGVYSLDMNRLTGDEGNGTIVAQAVGGALALGGTHLETLLNTLTHEGEGGIRSIEIPFATRPMIEAMQGMLSFVEGMEAIEGMDLDALRSQLEGMEDEALLRLGWRKSDGAFAIEASQGSEAMRLSGTLELGQESVYFIAIGPEEERYDVMDMDASTLEQLRGELNLVGIKFMHFADGSGLDDII